MEPHFYHVDITWHDGRTGVMSSPEITDSLSNSQELLVATPPPFPQGVAGLWSPEHLFIASIGSCVLTTFLTIAENSGLGFSTFTCKCKGKLEQVARKFLMTEVELDVLITIPDDQYYEKAMKVLEKSEAACLISNSVNSKIIMNPEVQIDIIQAL